MASAFLASRDGGNPGLLAAAALFVAHDFVEGVTDDLSLVSLCCGVSVLYSIFFSGSGFSSFFSSSAGVSQR
jgi:hypothetical protein